MIGERPYLSLVVTARNDDHGGNLLGRMQAFVSGWIEQARRHHLRSEIVVVEWNPTPDRPRLYDVLRWPADPGPVTVRFVEVSLGIHARFRHADALPLYQMIAKNVGIRRAQGEFVLATNIDILFSDELVAFLSSRSLDPNRMYRIDRPDVMSDVPAEAGIDAQLEYCRSHHIRLNARDGTFPLTPEGCKAVPPNEIASPGSGIVFDRGWFPVEQSEGEGRFRWADRTAEIRLPARSGPATLSIDIEPGPAMNQGVLTLEIGARGIRPDTVAVESRGILRISLPAGAEVVDLRVTRPGSLVDNDARVLYYRAFSCALEDCEGLGAAEFRARVTSQSAFRTALWGIRQFRRVLLRMAEGGPLVTVTIPVSRPLKAVLCRLFGRPLTDGAPPDPAPEPDSAADQPALLHTNACGDFTLLSRQRWFDLRGYPEFDLFSMNIDSVFCYSAHYGGAAEDVLPEPMRIYHIEHGVASGWTPEGERQMYERLRRKGIRWLDNAQVLQWATQMRRLQCPFIFNGEDWGLAGLDLPETRLPV